jgi:hypothetical protein
LIDEGFTCFSRVEMAYKKGLNHLLWDDVIWMDINKIAENTSHLAFITTDSPEDIYIKLCVCTMLADCESVSDYLQAWE